MKVGHYLKLWIALLSYLHFPRDSMSDISRSYQGILLNGKKGHALLGHVLKKKKVWSSIDCGLSCVATQDCKSVNLRTADGPPYTCVLNSATRALELVDYSPKPGHEYYDFNVFPKEYFGVCKSAPCKNGGSCRETDDGKNYTCACVPHRKGRNCEKVNGGWSPWSKLTPCSRRCGGGIQRYRRTCTNPPPHGGGNDCQGHSVRTSECNTHLCRSCFELYQAKFRDDAVYVVRDPWRSQPENNYNVFCDQSHDSGGWTVIQRRKDGTVNFTRGWSDYKKGFGNLTGEFWLGLDYIQKQTATSFSKLRITLIDLHGKTSYAEYNYFSVSPEMSLYGLSLGTYSGDAGDSLSNQRGMSFSTFDQDNDRSLTTNCASRFKSGWWFYDCNYGNLNGPYLTQANHSSPFSGITWGEVTRNNYFKFSEIRIKPHFN